MIACLVGAAYICWQLLLLSLIVAPAGRLLDRAAGQDAQAGQPQGARGNVVALQRSWPRPFSGIKVVKAFTMERYERSRFHETSKKCYRKAMRIALFDGLINPVTEVMGISTICLAILVGAYLVMNQRDAPVGHQDERPAAVAQRADGVLRHAGRRQRSGPAAVRGVQPAAAGRGRRRPHLSAARSRADGLRSAAARAAAAASSRAGLRPRLVPLLGRASRCWKTSTCGSRSAKRSPSSAPTAAARARWPI